MGTGSRGSRRKRASPAGQSATAAARSLALEERRLLSTFTVSSTADSGTGSLRTAIDQANAANGANTINFSALFDTPQTISLTSGQLVLIDSGLTITGPASGVTLSAGGRSRVFQINANVTASISGLSITEGSEGRGGGLLNLGGTNLTLTNCNISNNGTFTGGLFPPYGHGGGIANEGTLTLANCTISGNRAAGNGGGLYNTGTTTVINSNLSDDFAGFTCFNCDLNSNFGGGIYSSGTLTLTNSILNNDSAGGYGGGLYIANGTATLTNSTLSNDSAGSSYYGGGIYNNANATLTNCTLSDDSAGRYGGGMYNNFVVRLSNSTFSGNSAGADYYGGGLYNNDRANLTSCTFSNNSATYGGGVYNNSLLSMFDTIIARNMAPSGGPDFYGSVTTNSSFNLIGIGLGLIGISDGTNGNQIGLTIVPINPMLAPLGFYGGPTQTMALLTGSPAIKKGSELSPSSDQRGFPRDSPADIGAFQSQSGSLASQVNTTADGAAVPSGKLDLRGAVDLANVLSGAHTITFAPSVFAKAQTITLTSGQLELSNTGGTETIAGPAAGLTVSGGGLNRVFQVDSNVTASISGLTITAGGGTADRGGGLLILGMANLALTNCTVTGNTASTNGGGLANYGTVILNNCTVSTNTASKNGGGLFSFNSVGGGAATMTNCTVTANMAGDAGGGVENFGGVTTLTNCTVTANMAAQGGGLLNNDANSTTTLTNSTVTGNRAAGGAGLYNRGKLALTSCTVTANSAGDEGGGGLFNSSSPATLTNTIIAGNTNSSQAPSDIQGGAPVSGTFDLIGPGGSGGIPTSPGTGNIILQSLTGLGLAPLEYYGGPTQTMALLPDSKAIGAGTVTPGLSSDQRGFPLDKPKPDIGAFQMQPTPLVVDTNLDGPRVPHGKLDLRGAVNLANVLPGSHTITFISAMSGQTITLTGGQLELSNTGGMQTILGPATGVTVSGGGLNRVFEVDQNVTASLSGLTITGGGGTADRGGGLLNLGTLTLTNCNISGNSTSKATFPGSGGGLANFGTAILSGCTISGNTATSDGGGLANLGTLTLTNCTVSGNTANSFSGGGVYNKAQRRSPTAPSSATPLHSAPAVDCSF